MAECTLQDFASKYTDTNLAPDATAYDLELLGSLVRKLQDVSYIAPAIIVGEAIAIHTSSADFLSAVMLCAQQRGDAVPKLFRDLAEKKDNEQTKTLYLSFRHALSITWPFVGLPNCVPTCLGLVNELRERGIIMNGEIDRNLLKEADWLAKGKEPRQAVYRAVGKSEVAT